jgi:hypothetical protein
MRERARVHTLASRALCGMFCSVICVAVVNPHLTAIIHGYSWSSLSHAAAHSAHATPAGRGSSGEEQSTPSAAAVDAAVQTATELVAHASLYDRIQSKSVTHTVRRSAAQSGRRTKAERAHTPLLVAPLR